MNDRRIISPRWCCGSRSHRPHRPRPDEGHRLHARRHGRVLEKIGLLGPLAYVTIVAELVAGAALVAGCRTLFALAITPILFGSALPHLGNGW
jgi:hypothetical protein